MSNSRLETVENGLVRDHQGRFLKGCPPGPGRPRGSIDFMAVCRQRANEEAIDLEELVWDVLMALFDRAAKGDVPAIKLVLDRLCGRVQRAPTVAVQINNHPAPDDSLVPRDVDLGNGVEMEGTRIRAILAQKIRT